MNKILIKLHEYIHQKEREETIKLAREFKKQHPEWTDRMCVEQADICVTMSNAKGTWKH